MNRTVTSQPDTTKENITVVATQGFYVSDERAELVAFSKSGNVVYYNDSYRVYFDVDPVSGTRYTVEYVAAEHLKGDLCQITTGQSPCTRNLVERVNLTTDEVNRVYSKVTPRIYSARWHDVDRLNETRLVVADIIHDRVFAVNTKTSERTWSWNATDLYSKDIGGNEGDWTHINDVEVLKDGRIMVSVRNMDQVIFLRPGGGANASWTLGAEDNYSILYEQHNPDYIPRKRGGPAVVASDSENGRIVEYQRANGSWKRTWGWKDSRLQWPRDADRLPNGNTLVVDTHGDRIVEVAPDGEIVWSVTIGMPYDVERLGTGDESASGKSMAAIRASTPDEERTLVASVASLILVGGSADITRPNHGFVSMFWITLKEVTPSVMVNGLLYISPSWVRFTDLIFGFLFLGTALSWGGVELYWSRYVPHKYIQGIIDRIQSE